MPPIMGAAALVMADLTGTKYLDIMIAALVPALAYYLSLFVTVMFESRRMDMQAQALDEIDPMTRQDFVNVGLLVFLPLFIVIWRLVQGASPAGAALTAIIVLVVLSWFSPTVREKPSVILRAIANGGVTFGRLLMVVGVVGIIVAVMNTTDLPSKIGREITEFASIALVLTLILTAVVSLLVGMGMPTLPYLTVIIILGPALNSLGLSIMTSHMFVFYYGVASAITPPVAVAAFAAASIAGAKAIQTGMAAVRIGIVIFAVPFMFALNPDMMIVQAAFDSSADTFSLVGFLSALARTALMIYLLASSTSRFDKTKLPLWEAISRFGLAILLISPDLPIHGLAALVLAHLLRTTICSLETLRRRKRLSREEKPNFLYIMCDQLRADWLGCYGHKVVKTPNIDALAATGTRFDKFYVASPICMPNRASFMTGRFPSVNGLRWNGCSLPQRANTFVDVLRKAGYNTASIGKSHLQPFTEVEAEKRGLDGDNMPIQEAWEPDNGRYDLEQPSQYRSSDRFEFPLPYYGFNHVDMVTGHGDRAGGHYLQVVSRSTRKLGTTKITSKPAASQLHVSSGLPYSDSRGQLSYGLYS